MLDTEIEFYLTKFTVIFIRFVCVCVYGWVGANPDSKILSVKMAILQVDRDFWALNPIYSKSNHNFQ